MIRSGIWLGALFAAAFAASCVTNHAALEKKPGGDNAGGALGFGGASAAAGSGPAGSGGAAVSGGGREDDEPPGSNRLTIVNGVVDAASVSICVARVDDDGSVTPVGDPLGELGYAQSLTLSKLHGLDFAQDTLQPFLIAGDLSLIDGLSCAAAIDLATRTESPAPSPNGSSGAAGAAGAGAEDAAGGSASGDHGEGGAAGRSESDSAGAGGASDGPTRAPLRVRGLPAIPAGTLNQGRSMLFVAQGCLGGATYDGASAAAYCGPGYDEKTPTVSAMLFSLSRVTSPNRVGLQVAQASLANGAIDVQATPPRSQTGTSVSIASAVSLGQLDPRPASVLSAVDDLGSAQEFVLAVSTQGRALFSEPWSRVLDNGGLKGLENGRTYALVLSGPRGDLNSVPELWNGPELTAIAVDPE